MTHSSHHRSERLRRKRGRPRQDTPEGETLAPAASLEFGLRVKLEGKWPPWDRDAVESLVILQLGRPKRPNASDIGELMKNPAPEQRCVRAMLARQNRNRVSSDRLDQLSAVIHVACLWTTIYRSTSGMRPSRRNRRIRLIAWEDASAPKRELRRLIRACGAPDLVSYAKVLAALSPCAFDIVMHAAQANRIPLKSAHDLLCRECVGRAAASAIRDEALNHRLPMRAHDQAVRTVARAYELIAGRPGKRATTSPSGTQVGGKPMGALHRLLLELSNLYKAQFVSADSDERLRRRL